MRLNYKHNHLKIEYWDILLIIGMITAPMTGLRIWKVGPGEALCLIWGMRILMNMRFSKSDVFYYVTSFVVLMFLGYLIGQLVAPEQSSRTGLYTWVYLGTIAILVYEGLHRCEYEYLNKMIFIFAAVAIIFQLLLYEYSINVSIRFLGARLWFRSGRRYSGGAPNPHQVALMFCVIFFIFLRRMYQRKNFVFCVLAAGATFFLLQKTESATGIMSVALGTITYVYLLIINSFDKRKRLPYSALFTITLAMVLVVFYDKISAFIVRWIKNDSNGEGRLSIFSTFGDAFWKSPIFGLGPGGHSWSNSLGKYIELHNTYLEVGAATGSVGLLLLFVFTYRTVKKLYKADWSLIPIMVALYAFGFSGFAMRRLIYWTVLCFIVAISDSLLREKEAYNDNRI